jgi:hypothetical protein
MSPGTLTETQTVESKPSWQPQRRGMARSAAWATLFRIGGIAALGVVALVPIQAVIFVLWPPPTTVLDYFTVFQTNALLGLLDLDLLLIIDQLLIVSVLLGLYVALRGTDASLMLLGTTAGVIGALLFIVSREATFSMWTLSQQFAVAGSDAQRAALVAAGQTMLTTYTGTLFSVGYVLSGLAMLLASAVMLRSTVFSRATGIAGIAAGVAGLVPASFGTLGLVLSFISLLPMLAWLVLIGRRFLELGFTAEPRPAADGLTRW